MTLTQGTSLWAIQQMLEEKKIAWHDWPDSDYIHIIDGKLVDEDGLRESLGMFGCSDTLWRLWSPPNPHTKGTFAWAWEEIQRGNKVKVYEPNYNEDSTFSFWQINGLMMVCIYNSFSFTDHCDTISVTLINSTKWELA